MKYNPEKHHRKSIRLKGYDYSQKGAYFITICTQDRECLFGDVIKKQMILNQNGNIAWNCWFELFKTFTNLRSPAFVIMPNHIHGIIIIQYQVKNHQTSEDKFDCRGLIHQTPDMDLAQQSDWILMKNPSLTLGKVIRHFKAQVTIKIRNNGATHFQWQRNYHEEIIRNRKKLEQKRNYIINNPSDWEVDEDNPMNIKGK